MTRKKFNASLDENLIKRLKMQALIENTDVSTIIERLAFDYLAEQDTAKLSKQDD